MRKLFVTTAVFDRTHCIYLVFQFRGFYDFWRVLIVDVQVISSFRHHLEVTNDLKKQDRATYCSRAHKIEASGAILLRPLVLSR